MNTPLTDSQRSGIRIWVKMIREMDEERAVRFLGRIVTNLASDTVALNAILEATKDRPMN